MTYAGPRVMHAANMLLEAKRWIEKTHPTAWQRRGGRDHVWLVPNDEGASPRCCNILHAADETTKLS